MNLDAKKYDIVIIGNYTKDTIVSSSGERVVDGGGFNYGAHAAVLAGLKVAAVTRLAEEDFRVVHRLERLGVDVFAEATPYSTSMRLEYPTSNVDERVLSVTRTAGSFTVEQVAELTTGAFIINASVRGEVGLDVLRELQRKGALVGADVQGYVRVIGPDGRLLYMEWPERDEVLSRIDILKADAVEAAFLTGEKDLKSAARCLSDFGPREIVLTHRDGLMVLADGTCHEAPFCPKQLVGRSGRGDTCLGAYVARRLSAPAGEATVWAAAVTSLKMEAEGPVIRAAAEVEELAEKIRCKS